MDFKVLTTKKVPKRDFIDFWNEQYEYKFESLYADNIGKKLTDGRVLDLFKWKNGRNLSKAKIKSVKENYLKSKEELPPSPDIEFLRNYLNKPGGAIWRVFWLHCQCPNDFPIYDQHVHRAMATIQGWGKKEISSINKMKIEQYLNHYLSFSKQFSKFKQRKVDRALWAYGYFLNLNYDT